MLELVHLDFLSATSGFLGTILIFFFGLPPKINADGHINLIAEQVDEKEKAKAKYSKQLSYLGLGLVATSFFVQILIAFCKVNGVSHAL